MAWRHFHAKEQRAIFRRYSWGPAPAGGTAAHAGSALASQTILSLDSESSRTESQEKSLGWREQTNLQGGLCKGSNFRSDLGSERIFIQRAEAFLFRVQAPAPPHDAQARHYRNGKINAQHASNFRAC